MFKTPEITAFFPSPRRVKITFTLHSIFIYLKETLNGRKPGPIALSYIAGIETNLATCACQTLVFTLNFSFARHDASSRDGETTATRNPEQIDFMQIFPCFLFSLSTYTGAQDTR